MDSPSLGRYNKVYTQLKFIKQIKKTQKSRSVVTPPIPNWFICSFYVLKTKFYFSKCRSLFKSQNGLFAISLMLSDKEEIGIW